LLCCVMLICDYVLENPGPLPCSCDIISSSVSRWYSIAI